MRYKEVSMQQLLRNIRSIRLVLFYDLSSEWRHFLLRADIVGGEIEFFALGEKCRAIITKVQIVQQGVRISYKDVHVYGPAGYGGLYPAMRIPSEHIWVDFAQCKPQNVSGRVVLEITLAAVTIFPVGTSRKLINPPC